MPAPPPPFCPPSPLLLKVHFGPLAIPFRPAVSSQLPPEGCFALQWDDGQGAMACGPLRVEHLAGGAAVRISADLYDAPNGAASVLTPAVPPDALPILPRGDYRCYLKVTSFGPASSSGHSHGLLVTKLFARPYDMTFERLVYDQATERFRVAATYTAHLQPSIPPPGAPSGSKAWLASVRKSDGTAAGTMFLWWVTPHFREASIEVEAVTGTVPNVEAIDASGTRHDLTTCYASSKWKTTYAVSRQDIPDGSTNGVWAWADLHAAMIAHRDAVDLDKEWKFHVLIVPKLAPPTPTSSIGGIMYDDTLAGVDPNGVPREGVAVAGLKGFDPHPRYQKVLGKKIQEVPLAHLRVIMHELGHASSLIHTTESREGGADTTFMTPTRAVADLGLAGVSLFPDNITFAHNDHNKHHLMHFPDPLVRPGGIHAPHTFGQHNHSPQPFDLMDGETASAPPGLTLALSAARALPLGAPLALSLTLKAGASGVAAPNYLEPELGGAKITVRRPDGRSLEHPSFVRAIEEQSLEPLAKGEVRHASYLLFWSRAGFAFPAPGRYEVEAALEWEDEKGASRALRASTSVLVYGPASPREAELAAALMTPDCGRFAALRGADHFRAALEAVRAVAESDSPLAPAWAMLEAERLSRPARVVVSSGKKRLWRLRSVEPREASRLLDRGLAGASCCAVQRVASALGRHCTAKSLGQAARCPARERTRQRVRAPRRKAATAR